MNGKTCLVTGANSGIGLITARELARQGARVVMLCRSQEKAEAARTQIVQESGSQKVEIIACDLSSLTSVRKSAKAALAACPKIDVLLNNAGVYLARRELSADGNEMQLATNHLGPFLLTNLLLDRIAQSAPARVVTVSSGGHWLGRVKIEDLGCERGYNGWLQYCNTKLLNILFANELARRVKDRGITSNSLHPGGVNTNFAMGQTPRAFNLFRPFMISPDEGARTSVHLASSPEVEGVTGRYFFKSRPARCRKAAADAALAARLWRVSQEMTGLEGKAA